MQADPKPSFRNTRSKFYKRKKSDDASFSSNPVQNTGAYWKKKGNDYFIKGQINSAIQAYSKAIQMNSGQSIYFSNRARCYRQIGKLQLALKDSEQACQLDDSNIKAHYICGCVLAQIGKHDHKKLAKAHNRLKKALRLCYSLKKQQFTDQISIKLFRLKKLEYLLRQQQQLLNLKQIQKISSGNNALKANIQKQRQLINKPKQIPDHLLCKITLEIMEDPVITEEGFTYEKSAIEDHFKTNGFIDPITRSTVSGKLYSNRALKLAVDYFMQENPWAFEYTQGQQYAEIIF